jgi:hypothetical protein
VRPRRRNSYSVNERGERPLALRPCRRRDFRIPHDREEIPADAATGRFHEAETGVGGDGGIDGGTTLPKDLHGHAGGEWMTGGRHAVAGDHLRTGGEGFTDRAVAIGGMVGGNRRECGECDEHPSAKVCASRHGGSKPARGVRSNPGDGDVAAPSLSGVAMSSSPWGEALRTARDQAVGGASGVGMPAFGGAGSLGKRRSRSFSMGHSMALLMSQPKTRDPSM